VKASFPNIPMSDPLRTDSSRAIPAAPEAGRDAARDADRDAKIERLLLAGLDHYFIAHYDDAVHVWTRVLFLDRSHARARAYIERARSALAERQRVAEELSYTAAGHAGTRDDGTPTISREDAREDGRVDARLDGRLDSRTLPAATPAARVRVVRAGGAAVASTEDPASGLSWPAVLVICLVALGATLASSMLAWGPLDWRALIWPVNGASSVRSADPAVAHAFVLAPPRRAALALAKAQTLVAQGHLSDALLALDVVRSTDAERVDAERLRGEIQRQLIALASARPVSEPPPTVAVQAP
jgi:hypothetical protein